MKLKVLLKVGMAQITLRLTVSPTLLGRATNIAISNLPLHPHRLRRRNLLQTS